MGIRCALRRGLAIAHPRQTMFGIRTMARHRGERAVGKWWLWWWRKAGRPCCETALPGSERAWTFLTASWLIAKLAYRSPEPFETLVH